MAARMIDYAKAGLKHTLLFLFQLLVSIAWYAAAAVAAKVISLLESRLGIEGYVIAYIFKGLELYFLILGAFLAASYFFVQTCKLARRLIDDIKEA